MQRPEISRLDASPEGLEVTWSGGESPVLYPWIWLRDHCPCSECTHPQTRQRQFDTFAAEPSPRADAVERDGPDAIRIRWAGEPVHESVYPGELLRLALRREPAPLRTLWDGAGIVASAPRVEHAAIEAGAAGHRQWLEAVDRYGFCFVDGVPTDPASTRVLAERVGYVRNSIFGDFWGFSDGLAHADTAYTSMALPAHTDGTYCIDPPGLQMLHCVEYDAEGGDSTLVDGFAAAESLRQDEPELFDVLATTAVPGRYLDDGIHLEAWHPVVGLDRDGYLRRICFNNTDRAPFLPGADESTRFYRALAALAERINAPEAEYRFQLRPGTVLLFDNWRVLHGRTAYRGRRQVIGCYLNHEDFESRLRVLRQAA